MTAHRLVRLSAVTLMFASLGALTGCTLPFQEPKPAATVNLERAGRLLTQFDTKQALPMGLQHARWLRRRTEQPAPADPLGHRDGQSGAMPAVVRRD